MKLKAALLAAGVSIFQLQAAAAQPSPASPSRDYPVTPVPFTAVHLADSFWAPRIETNRAVTIPFAFHQCEESCRVTNFEVAAAALKGKPDEAYKYTAFPFDDTDIFKVIEGASFSLSVHPDKKLEAYIDGLIEKVAAAQEPDGYLYTARTFNPAKPHSWAGAKRWESERVLSHELYNLGHLYEAAAAHYQATGKRSLLDIAMRTVDLLDKTFGEGKETIFPGHQIVEMGLVRLYRLTGEERCLRLAKFFLDARHPDGKPGSSPYNQSHKPVTEQDAAVGHAVRAGYMYAGMADVAALTGDAAYAKAIDRIWTDVVSSKLYVTGGIGARHDGEAFGEAFELPNATAYNETCASIANVYWNHRLFLMHGDSRYIDVLETTLYNALLAGVSLDGRSFFYPNPLEASGDYARKPWFGCACCPGNLTRFFASISGYQYAVRGDEVFVNLYAGGQAKLELPGKGTLELRQQTEYPWKGSIKLTVAKTTINSPVTLRLRIPGWARGVASPGDLYHFSPEASDKEAAHHALATSWDLAINGKCGNGDLRDGYLTLRGEWKAGDTISIDLPMPVRRVKADERVAANRGRVALQRGPLVYCLESPDHPNAYVLAATLPGNAPVSHAWNPGLLGGVETLQWGGFTAIPYYAWANRGHSHMQVWIKE